MMSDCPAATSYPPQGLLLSVDYGLNLSFLQHGGRGGGGGMPGMGNSISPKAYFKNKT